MEINDMKELIEKIINYCYKLDEEIYWIPFERIFDNSEFDEDIVNNIKDNLNEHKDVKICDTWDYCFFIRVHRFCEQEEESER